MPVGAAVTSLNVEPGVYRLWVRTRDWCRPMADVGPGAFGVSVDGTDLGSFGTGGSGRWEWTGGVEVAVKESPVEIRLVDKTGFEGRVDALFLARGGERPPETWVERKRLLGLGEPTDVRVDFVVVGGGLAGLCAAVTAAREGLSVALVQDRPVFGGNASNEVRVKPLGGIGQDPFPHNGDVLREILAFVNLAPDASKTDRGRVDDRRLSEFLAAERRLRLFPSTRVQDAEKNARGEISAVVGRHVLTGAETRFAARFFVDATGDACVAVAAGAEWRGRPETRAETGERLAPDGVRKGGGYGSTLLWYARKSDVDSAFPTCPWAIAVDKPEGALLDGELDAIPGGGWNWETGIEEDSVTDGEMIRDRFFRAVYGVWDYTKNKRADRVRFAKARLAWMGVVLGKRAARRVIGDHVLCEQDLVQGVEYPDGVVTTDWYLDLHFPHPTSERVHGRNAFRSTAYDVDEADRVDPAKYVGDKVRIRPYAIPFRCLYSKTVPNLFLAGKDISATHVAMSSIRVMNTGGAMGTVVGRAAALCRTRGCRPCDLSAGPGLDALKNLLSKPHLKGTN